MYHVVQTQHDKADQLIKLFVSLSNFRSTAMSKVRQLVKDHYEWPEPDRRDDFVDRLLKDESWMMHVDEVCIIYHYRLLADPITQERRR